MNPEKFETIVGKEKTFYESQYPQAQDCVLLDQQIASIKLDLDDLYKRKLKGPTHEMVSSPFMPNPDGNFPKNVINSNAIALALSSMNKSKSVLENLLKAKENNFALADCRLMLEKKRADETAGVLTEASKEAEQRVLGESKKKQYTLIAVGGALLLTAVVIVIARNSTKK